MQSAQIPLISANYAKLTHCRHFIYHEVSNAYSLFQHIYFLLVGKCRPWRETIILIAPRPAVTYSLQDGGKQLALFDGPKKLKYKLLRKVTIHERKGFCTTLSGQKFAWNSHQYLVELKTNINGASVELTFLCEQGSSGVPAAVSKCTMSTTSDKSLQPTYTMHPVAKTKSLMNSKQQSSTSWDSLTDGTTASTTYAWSSGCKKNCNDEVDYVPIFSIQCSKKTKSAELIFWELGREKEFERAVTVWVTIDGQTTRLKARGASKLTGVSLDAKLPVTHPIFEELASGAVIRYGSASGTKGKKISLKGSGKAIRRMLAACR